MSPREKALLMAAIEHLGWYRDRGLEINLHMRFQRYDRAVATVDQINKDCGNRAAALIEHLELALGRK